MDTVEYLEQKLMNIAPIRHVATLRGADIIQVMNDNDQEEVTFNYLQTITDMESIYVMRQKNNEFFNQDQILIEINRRLDELCTVIKSSNKPAKFGIQTLKLQIAKELHHLNELLLSCN